MTTSEKFDLLVNEGMLDEGTCTMVGKSFGWTDETAEAILYYKTGYQNFDDYVQDNA